MKASAFKAKAQTPINELFRLINDNLAEAGDIADDSQKIFIMNRLHRLQAAIVGVTDEDMKQMRTLTETQQYVISVLVARGACFTARCFEEAWLKGQTYYIDARNEARKGIVRAIDQGNKEALMRGS